jgi:hypothetical protein
MSLFPALVVYCLSPIDIFILEIEQRIKEAPLLCVRLGRLVSFKLMVDGADIQR